jgi:hypothetical protein
MKIRIYKCIDKDKKQLINYMVNFFGHVLFPELMNNDDYILRIKFSSKEKMMHNDFKEIFGLTHHYKIKNKLLKKEVGVDLSEEQNIFMTTRTLIHELAHVKQIWIDNTEFHEDHVLWNGVLHSYDEYDTYWLYPWEIEAHGYETVLFNLFIEKYSLVKQTFSLPYIKILENIKNVDDTRRTISEGIGKGCVGN